MTEKNVSDRYIPAAKKVGKYFGRKTVITKK
jgi:hypothetical protein